jgi:hypothetical protein
MSYKITRSVVHTTNHNLQRFFDWVNDLSFTNDIQPLYLTLNENDYYKIIDEYASLVEPLYKWRKFFDVDSGLIDYSYTFNGIPEYPGVTSFTQEFVFTNQDAYTSWQLQENEKANSRISGWTVALEDMYIDYSNVRIEGTQMINNGETTDLTVTGYLRTKYFVLRKTQISVVHSIE